MNKLLLERMRIMLLPEGGNQGEGGTRQVRRVIMHAGLGNRKAVRRASAKQNTNRESSRKRRLLFAVADRGVGLCCGQLRNPRLAFLAFSFEYASILTPTKTISNPPRMVSWELGCTRNRHCPVRIVHSPSSP